MSTGNNKRLAEKLIGSEKALKYVLYALGISSVVGLGYYYYRYYYNRKPVKSPSESNLTEVEKKNLEEARRLKISGNVFYGKSEYKEAASEYSKAIEAYPNIEEKAQGYANRAACWMNLKQYEDVIEDCNKAIEIQPTMAKAIDRRSKAYEILGDYKKALIDATALLVMDGFSNNTYMKRSESLLIKCAQESLVTYEKAEKGKEKLLPSNYVIDPFFKGFESIGTLADGQVVNETLPELNELIGNYPKSETLKDTDKHLADLCLKRGLLYILNKEYVLAEKDIQNVLVYTPTSKLAVFYSACFEYLKGNIETATNQLAPLLRKSPNQMNVSILQSLLLMDQSKLEPAMDLLLSLEEKAESHPIIYYHLAEIFGMIGDGKKSIEYYDKVIQSTPSFISPYIHKVRMLLSMNEGQTKPALDLLLDLLKRFPDDDEIKNGLAEVCLLAKNLTMAEKYFNEIKTITPNMLLNKALLEMTRQPPNEALAKDYMKKAVQLDPLFSSAHLQLGNLLAASDDTLEEGIAHFEAAISGARNPQDAFTMCQVKEAALVQSQVLSTFPSLKDKYSSLMDAMRLSQF